MFLPAVRFLTGSRLDSAQSISLDGLSGCGAGNVRITIMNRQTANSRIRTALALALLLGACTQPIRGLHGSPYPSPTLAPALGLSNTEDTPFDLSTLEGHAVLVYFGYTRCPDECPLTLANSRWAIDQLGTLGERVDLVLVTVDPDYDTPAILREYLDRFSLRFYGLTGSDEQLAQARAVYGVLAATPESGDEHSDIIHGARLYLIHPDGRLVTSYDLSVPKEDILADLKSILESGA